jgi:L-seryl-tRNA(Ser) seleniumtransferase
MNGHPAEYPGFMTDSSNSAMTDSHGGRRHIPSVDRLAGMVDHCALPRPVVIRLIREELSRIRDAVNSGSVAPESVDAAGRAGEAIRRFSRLRLGRVLNGTGVLLHTNLGRAPLPAAAADHIHAVASGYCNVELDPETGKRGRRGVYVEALLAQLCEAEDATVVNNCAAALVLSLRHFCSGEAREVIISRSELIQIGGGFRIPEILETSGAVLREVGTTNHTTVNDYRAAVSNHTALILKVHQSNFFMSGFVKSPTLRELSELSRHQSVPLMLDLGSGAITSTENWPGVPPEPGPASAIREGADLVCFSGDKLFGGPQAGIIAGKAEVVAALRRNPFFRCLRCDKLILSGLEACAEKYLENSSPESLPVSAMASASCEDLEKRAKSVLAGIGPGKMDIAVIQCTATMGGGTLPQAAMPSVALEIGVPGWSAEKVHKALLHGCSPPLLTRIDRDRILIDLRTILDGQDSLLAGCLNQLAESITRSDS